MDKMKSTNEKVDMGGFITMFVDEFGELVIEYDDTDLAFDFSITARDLYEHLKEFFDE